MGVKLIFVLCAQACFLQSVIGQCLNRAGIAGPGCLAFDGLGLGSSCCGVGSTGGGFPVTSVSPVPPTGLNVISENLYEGGLLMEGNLPLLGSVSLEGLMGAAGAGAVSYGCGDRSIGITFEQGNIVTGILTPGVGSGLAYGPGLAYSSGLIGAGPCCGCGYGAIY